MPLLFRFRPRVEPIGALLDGVPLAELASRLPRATLARPLALLDGWPAGTSVLAFDPLPGPLPRSIAGLRALLARLAPDSGDALPGRFHGGFVGALAYELGRSAERGLSLPRDPWALPALVGGLYTDFLVRDEARGETHLVLGEDPGDGRPAVSERARELRECLARPSTPVACAATGPERVLTSRAEHMRQIERARELIGAGEIYQANLSVRRARDVRGDPLELYRRLVSLHPAPYAAFLRFRAGALLSASPELLLEFGADHGAPRARTRPIKGTAPRASDPAEDRARAAALLASEKDRGELAMIVDLERNDLGRIALPGGVRVEGFPSLASYASVHHLMADVVAAPRADVDAVDCLAALFPGGSVTGAPKLRSMEVIAELEGEGRGFAYGSALALDTRGELWANLLIRTLIWRPRPAAGEPEFARQDRGEVTFRVGGGITWGSDPAAEVAEAEAKGVLLSRALAGAGHAGEAAGSLGTQAGSVWKEHCRDALL